jgi:hypothetical protein
VFVVVCVFVIVCVFVAVCVFVVVCVLVVVCVKNVDKIIGDGVGIGCGCGSDGRGVDDVEVGDRYGVKDEEAVISITGEGVEGVEEEPEIESERLKKQSLGYILNVRA